MELIAIQKDITKSRLAVIDKVGTCVSLACAVHCLALPVVITVLPLIGLGFLAGGGFELGMILVSVSLATMSFCWGTRIHGQRQILLFILAAAMLFLTGHAVESNLHWLFMAIGGLSIALGHILNRKLCQSCPDCGAH